MATEEKKYTYAELLALKRKVDALVKTLGALEAKEKQVSDERKQLCVAFHLVMAEYRAAVKAHFGV